MPYFCFFQYNFILSHCGTDTDLTALLICNASHSLAKVNAFATLLLQQYQVFSDDYYYFTGLQTWISKGGEINEH